MKEDVVTIQKTSKLIKAWLALGVMLVFGGIMWCVIGVFIHPVVSLLGLIVFLIGLLTFAAAGIAQWWNHE
jgi:hypothetical protein